MMAQSVRIWFKKQMRLDHLTTSQREMVNITAAGRLSVLKRLAAGRGPKDAPAKPLFKGYAIYKSKQGKGNRRDLNLTGRMLGNFQVRTVSETSGRVGLTSRKERIKGAANMKREPWPVFSPSNAKDVYRKFQEMIGGRFKRLITSKLTGIDLG